MRDNLKSSGTEVFVNGCNLHNLCGVEKQR